MQKVRLKINNFDDYQKYSIIFFNMDHEIVFEKKGYMSEEYALTGAMSSALDKYEIINIDDIINQVILHLQQDIIRKWRHFFYLRDELIKIQSENKVIEAS